MTTWSPQQERALELAANWRRRRREPYFLLAGYAGTGKTTLARHLAEGEPGKVYFAAFTGKAASVLQRMGVPGASTVHKLIYLPRDRSEAHMVDLRRRLAEARQARPVDAVLVARLELLVAREQENLKRPDFYLNTESPLWDASLLVLDEYSMVDQQMGRDLLSFGVPILALGDPGQLPPVRGNQFFTGEPDVVLTEIHRQAADNPIIRLADQVRRGVPLGLGVYGESQVCRRSSLRDDEVTEVMRGADQVLVGMNNTRRRVNAKIRFDLGRASVLPVRGDRLVCLRNNHREGLLNGQTWTVDTFRRGEFLELRLVGEEGEVISCRAHREHFEKDKVELDPQTRRQANEFDFGYALTVHKAQGSQWDRVVLRDEWFGSNRRQWLYTAITRAAKSITIISEA